MTFAFQSIRMVFLASCVTAASAAGCIATSPVDFPEDENLPPSVVSQSAAQYPLRDIGQLNLDDPVEVPELPLEVIVRDPNVDQTLEYRLFLDSPTPPGDDSPIQSGVIEPSGEVERPRTFTIAYDSLTPAGVCRKIELLVSGAFANFVEPRRPAQEGDIDDRVWWIEVTDADNPVILEGCQ
jgi:hypothetical protein